MTAMVSSMTCLLRRAPIGAHGDLLSNRCATSPSVCSAMRILVIAQAFAAIVATAGLASAQEAVRQPDASSTTSENRTASAFGKFLVGAAAGLGAHESGHLLFDGIFDAHPGIKKVSFHGLPFFAITHDATLSPRREFVIDSAGFWVQEVTNEAILMRRPRLRREH